MSKIKKTSTKNIGQEKILTPRLPSSVGLCFSFKDFKKQSVKTSSFNNHFQDEKECFSVITKSLEKIKHISGFPNFVKLKSDEGMHCHVISNDYKDSVISILKEYGFPKGKIEELFEGKIYQVKIADGSPASRLIFYLIGGYILVPLFVDTNHQLYKSQHRGYDNNLPSKCYSL